MAFLSYTGRYLTEDVYSLKYLIITYFSTWLRNFYSKLFTKEVYLLVS